MSEIETLLLNSLKTLETESIKREEVLLASLKDLTKYLNKLENQVKTLSLEVKTLKEELIK